MLVGGATAFIVALSYVSANALWYQPHFHSGAFFATRANNYVEPGPPADETTIRIERQSAVETPKPKPDPVVEQVQSILQSMNLYAGDVDGINGPNTRKAVEAYRKTMGMEVSGDIDDALLEQLGAGDTTAGIQPKAVPVKAGSRAGRAAAQGRDRFGQADQRRPGASPTRWSRRSRRG